jgi:hypothetical protein
LCVKLSKCHFARNRVTFLGHTITPKGLLPSPTNLEALRKGTPPENKKQLQALLGLHSYYRRFVKDFAKKASVLCGLIKKDEEFK